MDISAGTDNRQSPQDDPTNLQNNEGHLKNDTETGKEAPGSPSELPPPSALPQAPTNCFSREEIVNEILDFTDQVVSTALYGSIGVGKSVMALTVLHHDRTKAIFGRNRHFMHCKDLTDSPKDFLERLSEATGTSRTADTEQLRSHLEPSPPHLLVLDDVDHILDPLAPKAGEFSAIIEELGCNQHVCLVTTSRMKHDIHGFYPVIVSTPSKDSTQETFYKLCNLGRSPEVDNLIERLDFHPLFVDLLARSVREKNWGVKAVFDAWDDYQGALRADYRQSLKEALGLSLRSPTIQGLGTAVHTVLNTIADFPNTIEERALGNIFPGITGVEEVIGVLCRFSLIYREDGYVKMIPPFQFYFQDSELEFPEEEVTIRWGPNCRPAKAGVFCPLHLFCDHGVIALIVPPIYKHLLEELPGTTMPSTIPPSVNGGRNRLFKRRKDDQQKGGFWGRFKRTKKGSATGSRPHIGEPKMDPDAL